MAWAIHQGVCVMRCTTPSHLSMALSINVDSQIKLRFINFFGKFWLGRLQSFFTDLSSLLFEASKKSMEPIYGPGVSLINRTASAPNRHSKPPNSSTKRPVNNS